MPPHSLPAVIAYRNSSRDVRRARLPINMLPTAMVAANKHVPGSGTFVVTDESFKTAFAAFTPSPKFNEMRLNVNAPFVGKFAELIPVLQFIFIRRSPASPKGSQLTGQSQITFVGQIFTSK